MRIDRVWLKNHTVVEDDQEVGTEENQDLILNLYPVSVAIFVRLTDKDICKLDRANKISQDDLNPGLCLQVDDKD